MPFAEIDAGFDKLTCGRRTQFTKTTGVDDLDQFELAEAEVGGLRFALMRHLHDPSDRTALMLLDEDYGSEHVEAYITAIARMLRLAPARIRWDREAWLEMCDDVDAAAIAAAR